LKRKFLQKQGGTTTTRQQIADMTYESGKVRSGSAVLGAMDYATKNKSIYTKMPTFL